MFAMFSLRRPDILPVGDLGLQKVFPPTLRLRNKGPFLIPALLTGPPALGPLFTRRDEPRHQPRKAPQTAWSRQQ
jgi:hypothetical protein